MSSLLLDIYFEAEIGEYFEVLYGWNNRAGPLYTQSGFRMMQVHELYFGFELHWWNDTIDNPDTNLPKTIKYLEDNFDGDSYELRLKMIMPGFCMLVRTS